MTRAEIALRKIALMCRVLNSQIKEKKMEMFDLKKLATAPLSFTYPITASVSILTTVTGDSRQYASVAVIYGSMSLWSGTMTQMAPKITIPYDIVAGEITIKEGGSFTLTIPTTMQNGSVAANLTIMSTTQTVPFTAVVASWPVSS